MTVERLDDTGWESTSWWYLAEIALNSNASDAKFAKDCDYYYLICNYRGEPNAYRLKRRLPSVD